MKTLLISTVLFLALSAGYAHAQTQPTQTATQFCQGGSCTYVPLEPLPLLPNCFGANCTGKTSGDFSSLIGNGFTLLIGAGGLIAVVMIVLGALTYMFSDVIGNKKKALSRIRGAMWAVVLLVSSYLILVTINPDLTKFTFNLNTTNNYATTPNPTGSAPAQTALTPTEIQARQNQCNQTCSSNGGVLRANADGSYSCGCTTSI